ncbi:DUF2232 domain-containing protein [Sneathiella chinensis]|uniref:DUF2232 domain-containing protein n=1 Tax=Sneathiella chinensis TaxID=349750 RepID=A0ABQ5U637_9PROT|nr:DUF2232 domain-containing protein [Sneathiella chinensis]GLQ07582.1 hypothetical protein GCM10007924_28030 [Sneathiella chinensis]
MIKAVTSSIALGVVSTLFLSLSVIGNAGGSTAPGSAFQAMALMTLSLVPLFLSGLGLGVTSAALSVAAGAVVAGLTAGPLFGLTYVATCGLPVIFIVRQALLWREADNKIFWYPVDRLTICWICVCIALSMMAALLLYMNTSLREGLISQFDVILPEVRKMGGIYATLSAEELVWFIPQVFGPFWGILILTSGSLAQGLLVRFGKNLRPTPALSGMAMPKWLALVTIGIVALSFILKDAGPVVGSVVVVLEIAFFLQGMAVIHGVSRNWNYRPAILAAVYLIVIVMLWPILVITLLGLADSWIGFRGRQAAAPHQEDD